MRNIELDSTTTLAHILNELKTTEEDGLELTALAGETTILENDLDKAIIEKVAKKFGKEIVFPNVAIEETPIAEDDNFGFVEGEDIVNKAPMQKASEMIKTGESVEISPGKKRFNVSLKLPKNKFIWLGFVLVFLILSLLASVFLLPTAEVDLFVQGEHKDSQATIVAKATSSEVSFNEKIVPLKFVEVTKEDFDDISTTGRKTIGTYATGRVTITKWDTEPRSFVKGTIITPVATSSAGLSFKTTEDVFLEGAPYGESVEKGVSVIATKLGPEGNLAANSKFKVGSENTPLVFAKNPTAFSGGSIKEAQVASAEDRDKLKNKVLENLTEQAQKEILKKNEGSLLPKNALEVSITKETYDPKEVDAEADKLKLTLVASFKSPLVKEKDVKNLLVELLEKSEKSAKVNADSLKIELEQIEKNTDGSIKLLVKYKTQLLPEFNKTEIARQMEGKSLSAAENYLDNLDKISGYEVTIKPSIFRFFGFMPFSKDRIKVNLKTQ